MFIASAPGLKFLIWKSNTVYNDHPWDSKIIEVARWSEVIYAIKIQNGTSKQQSFYTGGSYSEVVLSSGLILSNLGLTNSSGHRKYVRYCHDFGLSEIVIEFDYKQLTGIAKNGELGNPKGTFFIMNSVITNTRL